LPDPRVVVTIIDDPSVHRCEGNCAVDWSKPESLELAREKVAARFGGDARLEYVDLATAGNTDSLERLRDVAGGSLPILVTNGRPRVFGEFDIRQILDVIEADIEAGMR